MTNYEYFEYSQRNPEVLFDPFYTKGVAVIPADATTENTLITNHRKMVDQITVFKDLRSKGLDHRDPTVIAVVNEIVEILDTTPGINYSPFSQFFMVYNSTYSYFKELKSADKFTFVYEMLLKYCAERHDMYLRYGYSDVVLQVMSDNYSHKRNSKSTIEKILTILKPYDLKRISELSQTDEENFFFLPDKGDRWLFEQFLGKYGLQMESRSIEQNKLPDMVFNCNGQYYICEMKTMKGSGGGQNKQIVEVVRFINFTESDPRFHYIVFLDGDYANTLFTNTSPKIASQREDISEALRANPGNYFVNTAGFKKLVEDIFI